MADIQLFKGGVLKPNYMWHKGDYPENGPPFAPRPWNSDPIPRYNAQVDGVFNLKDYAVGYPLIPSNFKWQREALARATAVGDILQLIVVPVNHYVDFIRFDVSHSDVAVPAAGTTPAYPGLTGALAALTVQQVSWDITARRFVTVELPDVTAAVAAQGLPAAIPLDVPSSTFVSLLKVDSGYVQPLYSAPQLGTTAGVIPAPYWIETGALILGLKITALPADVKLDRALNDFYLAARVRGLDCPAGV